MNSLFKQVMVIVVLIAAIPLAFYIGKTKVNLDTMTLEIDRPLTALLFYLTLLMALIEDKYFE